MKQLLTIAALVAFCCSAAVATANPFTTYSEVPEGTAVGAGLPEQTPAPPQQLRSLTFYNNRGTFDAAFPGLTQENFSNTNVPPNGVEGCPGPFNSATNNLCFSPGDIVPGISLDIVQAPPQLMVVLTPPFLGISSVAVGPNTFDDDAIITFSNTTNAFGTDIINPFGTLILDIEVFGPGGSLGTTSMTTGITPVFWGVSSSPDPITRIEFVEAVGSPENGELFQNVEFGVGGTTPVEPATWGHIKQAFK